MVMLIFLENYLNAKEWKEANVTPIFIRGVNWKDQTTGQFRLLPPSVKF